MPIVMKTIARKRLQRRGAGPQVIVNAGRDGFHCSAPNRCPPLVANRAGQVDLADRAVVQMLHGFEHPGIRSRLASVLANAVVLLHGTHQLPSFKAVMRAWLFHIHVFPGLARPDGHQRVPMIGRSDGNGVDIFVLEQLANIDVGFGLGQSQLLDIPEALVQHVFIHIAQGGNLCPWNTRKTAEVIVAATSHSANCHPDTIIGAQDSGVAGCRDAPSSAGYARAGEFQKVAPRGLWCRHTTSIRAGENVAILKDSSCS